MRLFSIKVALPLLGVVLGFTGIGWMFLFESSFGNPNRVVDFPVPQGVGSFRIAKELEKEGLIQDADMFRLYLKITGEATNLKAGYYEVKGGQSISEIAALLVEGRVRMTTFTIPEGWHNRQIAELMETRGFVENRSDFLNITQDREILRKYKIPADSTEGYLFPDTYTIPEDYPAEKIHEAMLKRFFRVLSETKAPADITPEDLHTRVILASIIEREAAKPEELPAMAGVFQNRIDQGMRLESCATVQYLLPRPRKKLYEKDLKIHSPYNTYLKKGLPPGPISNPGLKSLQAVFAPRESNYLFFVLKQDGTHHFSSTYSEHLRAKKEFLDTMEGY